MANTSLEKLNTGQLEIYNSMPKACVAASRAHMASPTARARAKGSVGAATVGAGVFNLIQIPLRSADYAYQNKPSHLGKP